MTVDPTLIKVTIKPAEATAAAPSGPATAVKKGVPVAVVVSCSAGFVAFLGIYVLNPDIISPLICVTLLVDLGTIFVEIGFINIFILSACLHNPVSAFWRVCRRMQY